MKIDPATDILGLIDVQPTFMPGGALAVAGGDAVVPVCNALLGRFDHAFATQDWHPPGHASFASSWPGRQPFVDTVEMPYGIQALWPDHAIQGTAEAALHPDLALSKVEAIIRKGFRRDVDSYSAFFENDRTTVTGLDGWLKARGFKRIVLAGLATDFCVAWSAEDALRLGYKVAVVIDACRGIGLPLPGGGTSVDAALAALKAGGADIITSKEIIP